MDELEQARARINSIDKEISRLFEERMQQSYNVAEYKIKNALAVHDAAREAEVIARNSALIKDPVIREYYVSFQKAVLRESNLYQARLLYGMKVAYCGVPGAFAHISAKKMFAGAQYIGYPTFADAYQACEKGEADACVLPIENSTAGDVGMVMDLVYAGPLYINRIDETEIVQNLIGVKGASKLDVTKVISHPQALAQSNEYIMRRKFEVIEATNTAVAAKQVAETGDKSLAAIASTETAELYGLEILDAQINTLSDNKTRFAAFSKSLNMPAPGKGNDKHFIVVFTVVNEAGSLAKTLNIIGANGFNMRNLRSRPIKGSDWSYYFFAELDGNVNSDEGRDLLRQLKTVCGSVKLVGSYTAL